MSRRAFCLFFFVLVLKSSKSCDSLKNVKAKIYFGTFTELGDPHEINLVNGAADLINATRVIIKDENIPKLCVDSVIDLEKLEVLLIVNSEIKEIEKGAFKNLPKLVVLNLTRNKIEKLDEGVFDGVSATILTLANNSLENIAEGAFKNMPKLESIDLSHNKLKKMNKDWFNENNSFFWIIIENNELTEIPEEAFINMNVGENRMELRFSHNKIEKIHPNAFKGVKKIQSLEMFDNKLSDLHHDLFKGIEIGAIFLDDNNINCLSDKFLNNLNITTRFDIEHNPLNCQCSKDIIKWGETNHISVHAKTDDCE